MAKNNDADEARLRHLIELLKKSNKIIERMWNNTFRGENEKENSAN